MRREVLNIFKKLHRTAQKTFQEDARAICEGKREINEHFRKNKDVKDENEIKKMVQLAVDVEKELRTNVIQAVKKEGDDVYELRISEETTRLDNFPFDIERIPEKPARRGNDGGCCGGGGGGTQKTLEKS